MKREFILFFSTIIIAFGCLVYGYNSNSFYFQSIKNLFSQEQRSKIRKVVLPYSYIKNQEEIISYQNTLVEILNKVLPEKELLFAESEKKISIGKPSTTELSNGNILYKFKLNDGFYYGVNNTYPGSGYIDFHGNNLVMLSSRGVISYVSDLNNFYAEQIKSNVHQFMGIEEFYKDYKFSFKDILISKGKIYVSFTEHIKQDCWNTSILVADFNYTFLNFKKAFSPIECVHSLDNEDNEFNGNQSGGRMVQYGKESVLLTIGDYRSRHLAQDTLSVNGKILKLDTADYNYEIFSMGHRNSQGLFFDQDENIIISTEHGPKGGDEINLLKINEYSGSPLNYGWPISSAGEHYVYNSTVAEKYPLHNSHIEYGFIEPLKSFVPSIGISEIVKVKDGYVASSMSDESLYFFNLNESYTIDNIYRVEVYERVRDLKYFNNILYLFLEDSPSIGLIKL